VRINTAKQKMIRGEPAFGYALGLGSALVAEQLSRTGIDFLLIDTQHGSFTPESVLSSLVAMEGGTAVPMARVARNDYTMIGRLLDEGALGIVVPMVDTVEQARAAAMACRFPPVGMRSWGWSHAAIYGDDYPDWINEQLFVAVQIESARAVENAEAILAVPGIDGCWIGPADLALSMGIDPRRAHEHEEHQRAIERIIAACRNTGKIAGLATADPDSAWQASQQGFRFLTAGSDIGFLMSGARAGLRTLGRS
jgi:4-hydroxy-2-oxoheptanedioate aldolase